MDSPFVEFPDSIAFDGEEILVLGQFGNLHDALVHVDPKSGFRTLIVDFEGTIGPGLGSPGFEGILLEDSLAVDPAGNVFILEVADFFQGGRFFTSKVWKVDPTIAKPPFAGRILLSDFGDLSQGETGRPSKMAVDASGTLWVVGSQGSLPVRNVLFKVDPKTGRRTLVERDLVVSCASSNSFSNLTVDASGNILLAPVQGPGNIPGALFSLNPTPLTPVCAKVTDFADRAQGELGERVGAVAVAPTLPAQPVDLTIANMEVTQAIQNFANDVPLVQDKTVYVRVYPKVDMADRRVGARLRGFRGGAELPGSPLRPLYPLANVHTGGASRATLNDSFNFWVPPAWRSGNVSFQSEINFGGAVPETDTSNNVLIVTKQFTPNAPVCPVMIPVHTHGSRYTVNSPGFDNVIERFKSLWPVPKVNLFFQSSPVEELQGRVGIPPFEFGPYELPEDSSKVLNALNLRRLFSTSPPICPTGSPFRTVGMVSPDTNTGVVNGAAYSQHSVSWVKMGGSPVGSFNLPQGGVTMAHELTHNFGDRNRWKHVDSSIWPGCGKPKGINPDYPYPTNQIGPNSPDAFWGFDPITSAIITPTGATDFMSYCPARWVSDYTWKNIFSEINWVRLF